MTQQPENTDPIAAAGQIDDPDQPTTVHGKDDSRAGRDTQPDESSADGDPEQPGSRHRSAGAPVRDDAATAASASHGTAHDGRTVEDEHGGKPPKALRETGFPVVEEGTVDAQHSRDVDSEALAGTRKFQPRPGDANPNISDNPQDRLDHAGQSEHARGAGERASGEGARSGADTVRDEPAAAAHVAGPRGGVPDGAVRVEADASETGSRVSGGPGAERTTTEHNTADGRDPRAGDEDHDASQYQDPRDVPEVEPVRHSQMVEDRVQEQERDYDLGTTEDGERYLTPRDTPEV